VFEGALARAADAQQGLVVRRGVTVTGLVTRGLNGSAHVAGVETADGSVYTADLVVDAMGRGSRLPGLLARAGIASGPDELVGSRFLYYTRYFRGAEPVLRAPRLT
jgi:2-polyprenyl-6-methoxyphenol hydroxylase-like FAD-dependent oxidoreductase